MQAKSAVVTLSKSSSLLGKQLSQKESRKQDQDFAELLASGNAVKPEATDAKAGKSFRSTSMLFRKRVKNLMRLPSARTAT